MRLRSLHRYPVKSLAGEDLDRAPVDERGLVGDRLWAVLDPDGRLGSGKTTRRFRRMDGLPRLAARYDGEVPVVAFPDGRTLRGDDPRLDRALSAHVGRPVSLGREDGVPHHDEGPVHLVTTATLEGLRADARLLRANLVVEAPGLAPYAEDAWTGRLLAVGEVVLRVREPMPRCVMVGRRVLREVTDANAGCAGLVLDVVRGGEVAVGDEVRLHAPDATPGAAPDAAGGADARAGGMARPG